VQCTSYPGNDYHCWIIGEYLLWRFDSVPMRPFNAQVAAGNAIVFGRQATVTTLGETDVDTTINVPINVTVATGLPGGQNPDLRDQPGYRVFVGCWFNSEQTCGMEAGFFWLWNRNIGFNNAANLPGQTVQLEQTQTLTVQNNTGSTGSTTGSTV